MLRKNIFILLVCWAGSMQAQDSLSSILKTIQNHLDHQNLSQADSVFNHISISTIDYDSAAIAFLIMRSKRFALSAQWDSARFHATLAHSRIDQSSLDFPSLKLDCGLQLANIEYRNNNYNKALDQLDIGLQGIKNIDQDNFRLIANAHRLKGLALHRLWDPAESILQTTKAIELWERYDNQNEVERAKLYNNLSIAIQDQREYDRALTYLKKAIQILEKNLGPQDRLVAINASNIALAYIQKNEFFEADRFLKKALSIYETLYPTGSIRFYSNYNLRGLMAEKMGKFQEALDFYQTANRIAQQNNAPTLEANTNSSIGNVFKQMGDTEKAILYKTKALETSLKHLGHVHKNTILFHINLAEMHVLDGRFDSANFHSDQSLLHQEFDFNHSPASYSSIYHIIHAVRTKGLVLLREGQHLSNDSLILESLKYFEYGIAVIKYLRISYKEEASRQFLSESTNILFELSLEALFHLFSTYEEDEYFFRAFKTMEAQKQSTLLESIQNQRAASFAGVPVEIINYEKRLKSELERLSIQQELQNNDKIVNQLFTKKTEYDSFLIALKDNYPKYHQLKYDFPEISNEDLELWASGTGIIEFFVGDSMVYYISLASHHRKFHRVPKEPIDFYLKPVLAYVKRSRLSRTAKDSLQDALWGLHHLLDTVFNYSSNWLVIPDGAFCYLPFDILLSNRGQKNRNLDEWPFLIHTATMHYASSLNTLKIQEGTSRKKQFSSFLGFGNPINPQDELSELPWSEEEMQGVRKTTGGKIFLGRQATETNFYKNYQEARVIHLSMHTTLNDALPGLSTFHFSHSERENHDGLLNAYEIYNLSMNSILMVLSACNAGIGKMSRGEGLLSLSRAFAYAGTPSLLTTLWEIPDRSTSLIVQGYYKNLKMNMTSSQAIRRAKLEYLSTVSAEEFVHPFYWSAFIPIGSDVSVDFSSFKIYRNLGLLLIGLMLIGLWYWRLH